MIAMVVNQLWGVHDENNVGSLDKDQTKQLTKDVLEAATEDPEVH